MKIIRVFLIVTLFYSSDFVCAQRFSAADVAMDAGSTANIEINLINVNPFTSLGFIITLPEGFTFGDEVSILLNHESRAKLLNDKTMKMAYYSLNNDKFSESEIISIPIKAGFLESGTYQGTLSSNELGKVGGGVTHEAEATFNINVTATTRYYPVTFEQPEHGWLVVEANGSEIESGASIKERSTIVVSAIALEYPDYQLEQLTVNGREIENDSSFTLTEPVNIVAEFGSHVATGITKGEYRADNENTVVYDLSGRKVTDKQKSRNGGLREGVYIIRTPDGVRKISR